MLVVLTEAASESIGRFSDGIASCWRLVGAVDALEGSGNDPANMFLIGTVGG